jgi:hypothetical protein
MANPQKISPTTQIYGRIKRQTRGKKISSATHFFNPINHLDLKEE